MDDADVDCEIGTTISSRLMVSLPPEGQTVPYTVFCEEPPGPILLFLIKPAGGPLAPHFDSTTPRMYTCPVLRQRNWLQPVLIRCRLGRRAYSLITCKRFRSRSRSEGCTRGRAGIAGADPGPLLRHIIRNGKLN